jgi:hypothetical protein
MRDGCFCGEQTGYERSLIQPHYSEYLAEINSGQRLACCWKLFVTERDGRINVDSAIGGNKHRRDGSTKEQRRRPNGNKGINRADTKKQPIAGQQKTKSGREAKSADESDGDKFHRLSKKQNQ